MSYKIHGSSFSLCTRRAAVVFKEKGIDYELIPVDMTKAEHKSPEYLEKGQPFGKIPYLVEDDGFQLFESRAIARYIATKYADQGTQGLIPTDHKAYALFEQAASIEIEYFEEAAGPIFMEKIVKEMFHKQPADNAKVDAALKDLGEKLDVYEKLLSKSKYLAGDQVTLADLFHLPLGSSLALAGINILSDEKRPNVARWWKDITERPSWKAVGPGA